MLRVQWEFRSDCLHCRSTCQCKDKQQQMLTWKVSSYICMEMYGKCNAKANSGNFSLETQAVAAVCLRVSFEMQRQTGVTVFSMAATVCSLPLCGPRDARANSGNCSPEKSAVTAFCPRAAVLTEELVTGRNQYLKKACVTDELLSRIPRHEPARQFPETCTNAGRTLGNIKGIKQPKCRGILFTTILMRKSALSCVRCATGWFHANCMWNIFFFGFTETKLIMYDCVRILVQATIYRSLHENADPETVMSQPIKRGMWLKIIFYLCWHKIEPLRGPFLPINVFTLDTKSFWESTARGSLAVMSQPIKWAMWLKIYLSLLIVLVQHQCTTQ